MSKHTAKPAGPGIRANARRHRLLSFLDRGKRPETLPIRLGRKRIFILPTGFGSGFAVILAVMLLGALNYSNNAALLLTALLGAATTGSLFSSFRSLDRLSLHASTSTTPHAGEPLLWTLTLTAAERPRHALWLDIAGQREAFDVPAEHGRQLDILLPTQQRGWMPAPRLRIHTTWPFGMFRAWAWLQPDVGLLVYPKPEVAGPSTAAGAAPGDPHQSAASSVGGDQLSSLRAYRQGDPRKRIAWKASARHENLLVREFERQQAPRPHTLRWQDTAALAHEDRIRRLARWVEEAHAEGLGWTLQLPAATFGPDRGLAHYHRCMRALALLP